MDVSENRGTPRSSISKGFFIINHPFWGTTIFGNTHIMEKYGHDVDSDDLVSLKAYCKVNSRRMSKVTVDIFFLISGVSNCLELYNTLFSLDTLPSILEKPKL